MNQHDQYQIDQLILENGEYTPLDYLLRDGRLNYDDYTTWRNGKIEYLSDAMFGNLDQILAQLTHAENYLKRLGWQAEPLLYSSIDNSKDSQLYEKVSQRLVFSRDSKLEFLFHKRFKKSADQPQADLFMDSPATTFFNKVTQAICENDSAHARQYLEKLFDTAPDHARLGELEQLVDALESLNTTVEDVSQELQTLKNIINPTAQNLLRKDSRDLLIPLWRRLTKALEQQAYQADNPELHVSYTAMQSMDWDVMKHSIESEPNWKNSAILLSRHALACEHLQLPGESLLSWFELCWRFPQQSEILEHTASKEIQQYWDKFLELEPELPEHEFPAWLILKKPSLINIVPNIIEDIQENIQENTKSYNILCQLVAPGIDALSNNESMTLRAALKKQNPDLFQHYINTKVGT